MIKFGTSGWRAIIGEEFTFNNVRLVVQAVAQHVQKHTQGPPKVMVGYDTRFLSIRFAREAANVLASRGIQVLLADRDVPTPVIAFTIRNLKLDGGINFTASHNPPEYNGLKFSTADGAPAPPEVTKEIEREIQALQKREPAPTALLHDGIQEMDCRPAYVKRIKDLVDFKVLTEHPPKIGVDFLYGTSRGYTETLLQAARIKPECLHNYLDPYFGGSTPDCNESNLKDLMALVLEKGLDLGISSDGDADRFGIVDETGAYIRPNLVLGLLAWYLTEARKMKVGLGKTVATTNLLEAVAKHYKLPFYETPVGFKYLGELFLEGKIHFGGEESAGLSIQDHVPEKDGILAGLLVAEMVAAWKTPLSKLLQDMFKKFGAFYSNRADLHLNAKEYARAPERLKADPKKMGGKKVVKVLRTDGLKGVLEDGSWVLFRLSGTEPVVRIYAEAGSPAALEKLLSAAQEYFSGE
jgi:alpha-D-glucose phosphate-specific phosphoglucomutase